MRTGWKGGAHDPAVASFRYRVQAPVNALRDLGHDVEVFDPARVDGYDQVVFCKTYSPADRALARALRKRGGRVVFDLCDNHLYNPFDHPKYRQAREHIGEMVTLADQVVCSTPALAAILAEAYGRTDIACVPDAVEVHAAEPARVSPRGPLRLLWFGSHGSPNAPAGMTDLLLIREPLQALARRRSVMLTVCSNNRDKFQERIGPLDVPTRYVEWSLDGFGAVLTAADAVLLPAGLNAFTACKTHNRLTTAIHAGVPVVATGLESYRDFAAFCTLDDWEGGLQRVSEDNAAERRRALSARDLLDRCWSIQALAPRWEAALALSKQAARPIVHAAPRLHGRLDALVDETLGGWVHAPAEPGYRAEVVLEVEGEVVARTRADQARLDLEKAGLPADCGFVLPAPPPRADWRVRVLETDWTFLDRPVMKAEPLVGAGAAGPPLLTPPSARRAVRSVLADRLRVRRRALDVCIAGDDAPESVRRDAVLAALAAEPDSPRAEPTRRSARSGRSTLTLV